MSADINLDNVNVDLTLGGTVDVGLDTLMTGIKADIGLGNVGVKLEGGVKVDAGLDNIQIKDLPVLRAEASIKELPVIRAEASIKEIPVIRTDSKVDLGLDDIRIRELPPFKLELAFRPVRVHLPLNYTFCIEVLGIRLFKFSLCGEGMAVAEDYQPHPTERCGS
jgi:hypothetical protein